MTLPQTHTEAPASGVGGVWRAARRMLPMLAGALRGRKGQTADDSPPSSSGRRRCRSGDAQAVAAEGRPVPQVRGPAGGARRRFADRQRRHRDVLLLRREPPGADRRAAREGARRRRRHRAVRQGNPRTGRLGDRLPAGRQRPRAAPLRLPAPAAAGARHHRGQLPRRRRPRADQGVAPRHGHAGERCRPEPGAEVRPCEGQQALFEPGLFPQGVGALYHAGDGRHGPHCRRDGCRSQPQVHPGRYLAHPCREGRRGLRGGRAWPAHCPPRHRHRAAQDGPQPTGPRRHGAEKAARSRASRFRPCPATAWVARF